MLKSFRLATFLSATSMLSISGIIIGSFKAVAQYPAAPSSQADQLVCYMETSDGRTLNLNSLCISHPQVEIGNVFSNNGYAIGNVVNRTNSTVRNVQVNYEVLDVRNRVVGRSSTAANPETLMPGETAVFEANTINGGQFRAISVNWDN